MPGAPPGSGAGPGASTGAPGSGANTSEENLRLSASRSSDDNAPILEGRSPPPTVNTSQKSNRPGRRMRGKRRIQPSARLSASFHAPVAFATVRLPLRSASLHSRIRLSHTRPPAELTTVTSPETVLSRKTRSSVAVQDTAPHDHSFSLTVRRGWLSATSAFSGRELVRAVFAATRAALPPTTAIAAVICDLPDPT